ncbi:E3 ubiquitin-protein ligase ATL4 [Brachypodium distachyon]|uniref:RING-type domain-containing protein n=1 Tax=Brachypodium distachyon TaxID=15368 RepID=I1J129_BRADI|nr:E3 ubiquitin-protein ligase ATL4 [Brachypodium distachyon]KQJ84264.1 hypothetical protein BRADI_5g19690v3 [Brachypodium distachyon]|eukprot:XP_003581575.1 E3 ubiquitin-protein ligase ATL4 [Brachypodium distachyon]
MASNSFSPPSPPYYTVPADSVDSPASDSVTSALLIIFALLFFVCLASIAIHTFLRYLSRSSSSDSLPPLPQTDRTRRAETGNDDPAAAERKDEAGDEKQRLIESLPRFTMASALAALPKSSPDCAVCLSPFTPDAELRLLPACRHAFHAACVDAWLRAAAPTCPLCRAAVTLQHPSVAAILAAAAQPPPGPETRMSSSREYRSRSFRVEMGSVVSSRGSSPAAAGSDSRTYSLGSFDYHIDEEVEAVVPRTARADITKEEKPSAAPGTPSPPGEAVAEAAGSSPSTRGWLRDYLDRFTSSASSSFSFSGRWSSRWSQNNQGQRNEEPWLWDTEAAAVPAAGSDEEETAFMVLYRWIAAV